MTRLTKIFGVLAVLTVCFAFPAGALAKEPCWQQILDDWRDNAQIDETYELHCYGEAIDHLPEDARNYSGAEDEIRSAREEAIRKSQDRPFENPAVDDPPLGSPEDPGDDDPEAGGGISKGPGGSSGGNDGVVGGVLESLGPDSVDSFPLPLVVLGGLALAVVAAGSAGVLSRRIRARRSR